MEAGFNEVVRFTAGVVDPMSSKVTKSKSVKTLAVELPRLVQLTVAVFQLFNAASPSHVRLTGTWEELNTRSIAPCESSSAAVKVPMLKPLKLTARFAAAVPVLLA